MPAPPELRHLTAAALDRLTPTAEEASSAIETFYSLKAQGRVIDKPKLTLTLGEGHLFQALCCAVSDPPLAICKWIGVSGRNSELGLPNINGLAILSHYDTGMTLAVIDAPVLTAVRTAATSLYAARRLAPSDARSIAFVGTGVQAHSHLALFAQAFQGLREVRILAGYKGCDTLRGRSEALGLKPVLCDSARSVLDEADIVVSSVPARGGAPILDANWLPPGCFVSAVDLGRSWLPQSLSCFDLLVTDAHENSADQQAQGIMPPIGRCHADLSDLASGMHGGRTGEGQRAGFIFPGYALSDLAIAAHFLNAARSHDDDGTRIASVPKINSGSRM